MPKFTPIVAVTGPIPKRATERRRRNKVEGLETVAPLTSAVEVPATPEGLHRIAAGWFESLKVSGQAQFYEPSDWAAAIMVAEAMTRLLNAKTFSAMGFSAVWSSMSELLTTEGARRRVRMEIDRNPVEKAPPAGVTAIAQFRQRANT